MLVPCPTSTCPSDGMAVLVFVAEAAIGLWIWSVWSWRLHKDTGFRVGGAKTLAQEFQAYGYPIWVFMLVGVLKTFFASILVLAIIFPQPIMVRRCQRDVSSDV